MNRLKPIPLLFAIAFATVASAQVNSSTTQKAHADSVQRVLLQDSLGLSASVTAQVLALRDSCISQCARIQGDTTLTAAAQNAQAQTARRQSIEAVRELMGENLYQRYLQLLSQQ